MPFPPKKVNSKNGLTKNEVVNRRQCR